MVLVYSDVLSQPFLKFFEKPDSTINVFDIHDIYYDEDQKVYFTLFLLSKNSCQGFGVTKLGEDGEILNEYIYCSQDSLDQFLYFFPNLGLQKIGDDLFYFGGSIVFSGFRTFDYWFDSDLNFVHYNISDTISTDSVQAHQILRLASYSDNIVQAGQLQKLNFESDLYIKVIDNEGNDVWIEEYFNDDGYSHYVSSLIVHDSILILGNTKSKLNSSTSDKSQCHIAFVSQTNGEILHEFDLNLPEGSNLGPTEVIPFEKDGETLLAFSSSESTYNEDYFEFRSHIRFFITDLDGNVVDSIRLGTDSSISNGLFYNAKTEVGFVSSGNLLIDDTYRALVVGMFDERADTIWWSKYDFNDSEEYAEYYNITSQEVLPDGSIVLCGNLAELEFTTFQPIRKRPFVLKLDADGCLEPGCREGVNVNSILIKDSYDVSPNPSNGRFEIQGKYKDLQLLDVYGNKIYHTSKLNGNATVVEVPSFSTGIYFFNVTKRGVSETKKIILINN